MYNAHRFALFVILVVFSIGYKAESIAQNVSGDYALVIWSETSAYVQLVDPVSGTESGQIPLPVTNGAELTTASALSPDGTWIAYEVETRNPDLSIVYSIQLYNLVTSETRSISLPTDSGIFHDRGIRWSQDSQYIALNILSRSSESYAYVYSIANDTLNFVSGSSNQTRRLVWGNGSNSIVGSAPLLEQDFIEIYDVQGYTTSSTFPLQTFPYRLIVACNQTWSPDDTQIAFAAGCIADGPVRPLETAVKELHILNLSQNTIERVTDYTVTARQQGTNYFSVSFHPYWVDNQTLLVGVRHLGEQTVRNVETILYRLDTGVTSVIRSENIRNWVPNPLYPIVAYEAVGNYSLPAREAENITSQIGSFDSSTQTLDTIYTFPAGCDLSWSLDGEKLAIIERVDISLCRLDARNVIFAERATGMQQIYTVNQSVIDSALLVEPLGWIPNRKDRP